MNYLVSVICQCLQIARFFQTNKNTCFRYNLRRDSLKTQCVSKCVIGVRLGNVEHVSGQEEKVCGDQMSIGSLFNSLHFQT